MTLSVKLPTALHKRLESEASQRGTTKSAVVREALEELLRNGARPRKGSLYAMTSDLAGSLEGPRDLSSSKARMRGYGR